MFETPRTRVRHLTAADYDAMFGVYGHAEAMRWVDDGQPITPEDCARWIDVTRRNYETRGYGMSAIELRETGAVIGFCGLVHPGGQVTAEIKYALHPSVWGQGFATEVARGMIDYGARRFGLTRIIATIARPNIASQRVMAKAGMHHSHAITEADGSHTEVYAIDLAPAEGR